MQQPERAQRKGLFDSQLAPPPRENPALDLPGMRRFYEVK